MAIKPKSEKTAIAATIPVQLHRPLVALLTKPAANQSVFDLLPDSAWLRVSQLIRSPKRPDSTAPLPFSAPTLWRMVKAGTFPAPAKLSLRVTAWKCGQVREWMTAQSQA